MSAEFSLEFLQGKIGAEYVELNPVTGKPRIIQGLNQVWDAVDEHGGVSEVAKLFGLSEADVWAWIDDHFVPMPYAPYLAERKPSTKWLKDMQLSAVGHEDLETGACWPVTWCDSLADVGELAASCPPFFDELEGARRASLRVARTTSKAVW